jgi:hypothetical protein
MAQRPQELSYQIRCATHAAEVLARDEDIAPGLKAVVATLTWTERQAELIRAVVDFRKRVKGGLEVLRKFTALAEAHGGDIVRLLEEFDDVTTRHPALIGVLEAFPIREVHNKPLTPSAAEATA